ncbi:transposase [Streptococcus equi subsp. zooepidemicus Sz35]|nr:transposase [Streptococcus equi subsp. zooepidemicus Sz35]
MEQIHHTTLLIGIKDQNITFDKAIQHDTHIEVIATLDYQPPKCRHDRGKNKLSVTFRSPLQFPSLKKVAVSETNLVKKNCQISEPVRQKISQLLLNKEALTHIASKLAISTSTVYHKLKQCHFKEDYTTLPEMLSLNTFYSRTFRETLTPRQCLNKIFKGILELKGYYDLYQLLLFHLQEKNTELFFELCLISITPSKQL